MTDLRQAAQQALEALEWHYRQGHSDTLGGLRLKIDEKTIRVLKAALEQPQQEPTWVGCGECDCIFPCTNGQARCIRQPEQGPLTATVIGNMMPSQIPMEYDGPLMQFARDIEAAHGIKEQS